MSNKEPEIKPDSPEIARRKACALTPEQAGARAFYGVFALPADERPCSLSEAEAAAIEAAGEMLAERATAPDGKGDRCAELTTERAKRPKVAREGVEPGRATSPRRGRSARDEWR